MSKPTLKLPNPSRRAANIVARAYQAIEVGTWEQRVQDAHGRSVPVLTRNTRKVDATSVP